jgi:hypothetical protein
VKSQFPFGTRSEIDSDKPSDNDLRQRQAERNALRQRNPRQPAVIRFDAISSDEITMHGKEKVYGSIP